MRGRRRWLRWGLGIVIGLFVVLVVIGAVVGSSPKKHGSAIVQASATTLPTSSVPVSAPTTTTPAAVPVVPTIPTTTSTTTAPTTTVPATTTTVAAVVTYTVTANPGALITYADPNGNTGQITSTGNWTMSWPVNSTTALADVGVVAGNGSDTVACSITWGGSQVASNSGPGSALCDYYPPVGSGGAPADGSGDSTGGGDSGGDGGDYYVPHPHAHVCIGGRHIRICS